MEYGADGVTGIGWCRGPSACALVGPLDSYDPAAVDPLTLNPGSQHRIDVEEWGERAQRKHTKSHHKKH